MTPFSFFSLRKDCIFGKNFLGDLCRVALSYPNFYFIIVPRWIYDLSHWFVRNIRKRTKFSRRAPGTEWRPVGCTVTMSNIRVLGQDMCQQLSPQWFWNSRSVIKRISFIEFWKFKNTYKFVIKFLLITIILGVGWIKASVSGIFT